MSKVDYDADHKAFWTPRVRFNSGYHDGAAEASWGKVRPMRGHFDKIYAQGYEFGVEDFHEGKDTSSSDDAWKSRASTKRASWMPHRKAL